jgi:hypothetical protein
VSSLLARRTAGRSQRVAQGSLYGLQFHPEKSSEAGLRVLSNFVELVVGVSWPRRRRRGGVMLARRVIPCLDVDKGRVVKGTKFLNLTDEGDPAELAERYAHEGADEIVFLDITAAHERRGTMLEVVRGRRRAPSCRSPSAAACAASRRCATSCEPAPTRSRSTPRPSPTRRS